MERGQQMEHVCVLWSVSLLNSAPRCSFSHNALLPAPPPHVIMKTVLSTTTQWPQMSDMLCCLPANTSYIIARMASMRSPFFCRRKCWFSGGRNPDRSFGLLTSGARTTDISSVRFSVAFVYLNQGGFKQREWQVINSPTTAPTLHINYVVMSC